MCQIKTYVEWQYYFRSCACSVPYDRQGCEGTNNMRQTNCTLCPKVRVQEAADSLGMLRSGIAEGL